MSPSTSCSLPESQCGSHLTILRTDSYLALLQLGFTSPLNVTTSAVRSYHTLSPLPYLSLLLFKKKQILQRTCLLKNCTQIRRFTFCCTCRRLSPPRRYLAAYPMEPGLSSRRPLGPPATAQPAWEQRLSVKLTGNATFS